MLRYVRRLADRDLALDRSMIPLGSCTMRLNAPAEMIPLSWSEIADRIDNVYGDRNLFCSCPPITDLQEAAE